MALLTPEVTSDRMTSKPSDVQLNHMLGHANVMHVCTHVTQVTGKLGLKEALVITKRVNRERTEPQSFHKVLAPKPRDKQLI